MPSELQRVAQELIDVLDEVPRVVAYLQRMAQQCRENAALVGGMSNNPAARMAAVQLDEAARRCDEAAYHASLAPRRARAWAEGMVSGARVAERSASPGAKSRDAPAGDQIPKGEPRSGSSTKSSADRERIRIDLGGSGSKLGNGSADDRQTIELSTSNPDHLPILSAPPANATIRVDEKFVYVTDGAGRVISARAVLDLIDLEHPRDAIAQRKLVGKLPGDHAGHIFARIFRGPIGTMNLLPMQGTDVNLSQYKTLENHWRRLIEQVSPSTCSSGSSTPTTVDDRIRFEFATGMQMGSCALPSTTNRSEGMPNMTGEGQELLTAVGQSLARSAPADWRELELRISGAGGMTRTIVSATRADGSVDRDCELDDDGDDAAASLRESMYQQGKGTWYNAHLTLDSSGQLDADFDYEDPPFDGDADRDLLIEDQRLFPRDPEMLPSWHPAREQ